ncbi:unnamed protein product [Paramecium sonneborni]|uniref:Uncharacterized protein n=1 Tax=Paramecium sonneborni TaxID=65129 RepID=A0A8S1KUV8_9CILI|nr:unnamed protein product [Paramecium sonneborni]
MENDYLKSIQTMFSIVIVESSNQQSTQELLGDFYRYLDSISNEKQLTQLQQLIKVCYESPDTQDDKKQILNQIRLRVKQKIPNTNQDHSQFLVEMNNKNQKRVGVSILNNDGSFILTDQLTRKILEIKNVSEIQKRLFEYCAVAGQTNLMKQFHEKSNFLEQNEVEKQFQMTIYSEKTRKKALKHLNQQSKKVKKSQQQKHLSATKTRVSKQNNQSQTFNYWDKIKIKYLKTITIKITKVIMSVNEEFLDSIKNSNQIYGSQQLQLMAQNSKQMYNVVKCEISENPFVEEIHQDDILNDQKLLNYEDKWKKKCEQISKELKKPKEQQGKIENHFQNYYGANTDLQLDHNSHQIQYQWY